MVPLPSPLRRLPEKPPRTRAARAVGDVATEGIRVVRGERVGSRGGPARALSRRPRTGSTADGAGDRTNLVPWRGGDSAGLASEAARRDYVPPAAAFGLVRRHADIGWPVGRRRIPPARSRPRARRRTRRGAAAGRGRDRP